MLQQLISLSSDLKRLRDEGYELDVIASYLVVRNIPYVNQSMEIKYGDLISELTLAGDVTIKPHTHVVYFSGDIPCNKGGNLLSQILNSSQCNQLAPNLVSHHMFSSKPKEGYQDFYEKMTTYSAILSSHAQAIDPSVSARNFSVIESQEESVFHYLDTASSRAGISDLASKFNNQKIGIIGLGGTGSYVLDFVAKTPVKEIHLFDKKRMMQHNAFRIPGAPSISELRNQPPKVRYLASQYGNMHKGIIPHNTYIDASNIHLLADLDFVFLCLDNGSAKPVILDKLNELDISFTDVGMGIYYENGHLGGQLRVTTGTNLKHDHLSNRISTSPLAAKNDEYSKNIQIADLNTLNATLTVLKWKKLLGFYWDSGNEHCCFFKIAGNKILNEDKSETQTSES